MTHSTYKAVATAHGHTNLKQTIVICRTCIKVKFSSKHLTYFQVLF